MLACIPGCLVERAHEGAAGQQALGIGARGDRGGNGAHDVVVDLVVLALAQARRQADLEDEEFAGQRGRIEVIRQAGAVAYREAPQFGALAEEARDAPFELRFGGVHFLNPSLLFYACAANILRSWSTAMTFFSRPHFISQPRWSPSWRRTASGSARWRATCWRALPSARGASSWWPP